MNLKTTLLTGIQNHPETNVDTLIQQINQLVIQQFMEQSEVWQQILNRYYSSADLKQAVQEDPGMFDEESQKLLSQPQQPSYYTYFHRHITPVTTQTIFTDIQKYL